jgi:hypothetical protein
VRWGHLTGAQRAGKTPKTCFRNSKRKVVRAPGACSIRPRMVGSSRRCAARLAAPTWRAQSDSA